MSENDVIFIRGAIGFHSVGINGPYNRISVTLSKDGYAVYGKLGDASMCIEHYGGKWQVKSVCRKGRNRCFAYVTGGCALEACASRVWKVAHETGYDVQSNVEIVTGLDAEREVSDCCMRPQQRTNQFSPPGPPTLLPPPPCESDVLGFCAGR
jgi:hypothetical protein